METVTDLGARDFVELLRTSRLDEKMSSTNMTVFAPSDEAVRDFTDALEEAVSWNFSYRIDSFFLTCFSNHLTRERDNKAKGYVPNFNRIQLNNRVDTHNLLGGFFFFHKDS